jgi:Protein of unknown function (DUF499)
MGILRSCKPRKEVFEGDLEDAIFAADFGDLIAHDDRTPLVYRDAATFFANTHPAADLKRIVEHVFARLSKKDEGGAVIRLSTGFGGGKTHTLMTLWHLAQNIGDAKLGTELLAGAGRPKQVAVVAVDAQKAGAPVFLRHGAIEVQSLQGEVAYQLGRAGAIKKLGKADHVDAQPDETLLASLLPDGPVLILLDELVIYMAGLSEQGQGNLLGVLGKLVSIAAKRPQTVLVVTDPGAQAAYAKASTQLQKALETATKLGDILGRKASDFDPIGAESARVIARRLFERVEQGAAQAASATYHALYERVAADHSDLIPATATSLEYAKRLVECYPFHPRLLDTASDRLGALEDFQKSRGVLRLFARILRDVWQRGEDLELITAGDLDWASARIRGDLLQRLNRDNFAAAVSADVEGHATELDGGKFGIHRRVASALLLESLPLHPNSGLTPDELTLAVLRPDEAGPEPSEALDRLVGVCWHTYPMAGGRGWQFRYDPNVIKQIEERRAQVSREDAEARVLSEAQQYFGGAGFKLRAWPDHAKQVPDTPELQLAMCQAEAIARSVCANADDSDPNVLIPRRYINAIGAVTATPAKLENAISRAQGLIAAEEIEREYRTGEQGAQIREQLKRLKPELDRQFRIQTRRAFDRVVLAGDQSYAIDESFQGGDDEILRQPRGQEVLRKFLTKKELIFESTDALDATRLVRDFLPGATPVPGQMGVYTAKAVVERLFGAPGLRLMPDEEVVRRTLLRAVQAGKLVLKTADSRAFDARGAVGGPAGARRRVPDAKPVGLALSADVLVALPDGTAAQEWLREEAKQSGTGGGEPPPPPPPKPGRVTVHGADQAARMATERQLLTLKLSATATAVAQKLASLAQPFGAESVTLTVSASGDVRTGGTMSYAADGVKLTHPSRPLETATLVANSLADGSYFEATLVLLFGEGREGAGPQLAQLDEHAADVRVECEFGPPLRGNA